MEEQRSFESRNQKRLRLYKTVFPLTLVFVLTGLILSVLLTRDPTKPLSTEIFISIGSVILTLGVIMFNYLESKSINKDSEDTSQNPPTLALNYVIKEFQQKLEKIETQVESISKSTSNISLLPEDKDRLFKYIEQSFSTNINETIFKYLEEKYQERSKEIEKFQEYLVDFTSIKNRILSEIRKLSLRANTNLTIGSITTISAVVVLYITVSSDKINFTDTMSVLSHFIPRLAVVIFIEVFAFFFLKLYRNNIDNIKYYHNELTNIDLKLVSLKQAIKTNDVDTTRNILTELSKTERNFVIKKEETTIELEKIRQDGESSKNVVSALTELLKLKKS